MSDISASQRQALDRVRRQPGVEHVVRRLWGVLQDLDPGERLAPDWAEIWAEYRPRLVDRGEVPLHIIEEIDAAITQIEFIDPEIRKIKITPQRPPVFLLGAGASAPEPSSIPTVANLLPELWRRARKIGRDDLDRLADWCEAHAIRNIEDLLTAAYIANYAAKNSSVIGLLDYFLFGRDVDDDPRRPSGRRRPGSDVNASSIALFQDTLQTLFGLLASAMIPAQPNAAHSAVAKFLSAHGNTRVVTTNYDGCMDEALLSEGRAVDGTSAATEEGTGNVDLIKMHGSINWSYCDSCQAVHEFSLRKIREEFEEDTASYAVIGVCKNCGGQRRPLLVPPLSFKFLMFPNLVSLWNAARRAIDSSGVIIAVGYSFAEADTYITKMISRSLATNRTQRLIICDTDNRVAMNVRKRFCNQIEGLDPTRILTVLGSCEETVPQILSDLSANAETRKPSVTPPPKKVAQRPKKAAASRS